VTAAVDAIPADKLATMQAKSEVIREHRAAVVAAMQALRGIMRMPAYDSADAVVLLEGEGFDQDVAREALAMLNRELDEEAEAQAAEDARHGVPVIVDAGTYIETEPPPHDPIIEGCFEAGDKVGVIAASKRRKTWFVLHLAICCATGRTFLGWRIPKPRRVLIIQLEIKPGHYHRRVRYTSRALAVDASALDGRLGILSARGAGIEYKAIKALVQEWAAELVIVDPLYKVATGDENLARDMKPLLAAFDAIATDTGAAVLWVHHDAKGNSGDRDSRDRGAGSNVLVRDVDQLFTLTPHRDDPEATVIETLTRNFEDGGPRVVVWRDGAFIESDLDAIAKTSANTSKYADQLRRLDESEPGLSLAAAARRMGCDRSTVSRLRSRKGGVA
jgi:RecA-family ATPase